MNRVRHAYLEIAPELEPYFVSGHHDDQRDRRAIAGVVGGLIAKAAGAGSALSLLVGAVVSR